MNSVDAPEVTDGVRLLRRRHEQWQSIESRTQLA